MGRKNIQQERAAQILDAFSRCVVDHGLAETTLERVAEYAGLGRPAIRHNIGNRDALIEAALMRMATEHMARYAALVEGLPACDRLDALLEYLFVGPFSGAPDAEDVIVDELFAVRHRQPRVSEFLDQAYRQLQQTIARELAGEYPNAGQTACADVAYLIMTLAFGHSTFSGLGVGRSRGPLVLQQARMLATTLEVRCETET